MRIGVIYHKDSDYLEFGKIFAISFDIDKWNKEIINDILKELEKLEIRQAIVLKNIKKDNFNLIVFLEKPISLNYYWKLRNKFDDYRRVELDIVRKKRNGDFGRVFIKKENILSGYRAVKQKFFFYSFEELKDFLLRLLNFKKRKRKVK